MRIQVKARKTIKRSDSVILEAYSSGPGYSYKYSDNDVDLFVLYCLDTEEMAWVKSEELLENNSMAFRFKPAKNNQKVRIISDYNFEKFLDS